MNNNDDAIDKRKTRIMVLIGFKVIISLGLGLVGVSYVTHELCNIVSCDFIYSGY